MRCLCILLCNFCISQKLIKSVNVYISSLINLFNLVVAGLHQMSQLRVLRLFGFPINYSCMDLWKVMLQSISQLSQITEFSVINLLRNVQTDELKVFYESLPANLSTLALHHVHQLQDDHFSLITQVSSHKFSRKSQNTFLM